MNTLISRASKTLNGYDMRVLEEVDDQMFYDVAREEVIALRLELREPLSEKDVTALSGERGMNLPTDFIEFYDQTGFRGSLATDCSCRCAIWSR